MVNHPNRSRYAIRCDPHYFAGDIHHNDRVFLVRAYPDERVVVLSRQEDAATLCRLLAYHDGPYRLEHNQYSRPTYEVAAYKGNEPAISLLAAAWDLGYGFDDDGRALTSDQLRAKVMRLAELA